MSESRNENTGQKTVVCLIVGILTLTLTFLVFGNGRPVGASQAHSLLWIENYRISGILTQVPLRGVLEQLQRELAIEYVVSGEELDKRLSANIVGESVPNALSKILASWDYALQLDQQGRVHKIFVTTKIKSVEIKNAHMKGTSESSQAHSSTKTESKFKARLPGTMDPQSTTEISENTAKIQTLVMEKAMVTPGGSGGELPQMVIQPPQATQMVIQPPQATMKIKPPSNFMQVIPASGFMPMEIHPVSEEVRKEFLGGY